MSETEKIERTEETQKIEEKEVAQDKEETKAEESVRGKDSKQSETKKAMNSLQAAIVVTGILIVIAALVYKFYEFFIIKIIFWFIVVLAVLFGSLIISFYLDLKTARKVEKLEAETEKEEQEFAEIDFNKRALRAEKMFKMNQKELMRYYDMNLAQTKFLSVLGIVMIILGILIVVASLVMYMFTDADKILLFVGNVSGILIDFVGAVFIRMYTQNVEAAVRFHAKFAESNNLLLANSIANKIDNEELREETLAEIAKDIVCANKKGEN